MRTPQAPTPSEQDLLPVLYEPPATEASSTALIERTLQRDTDNYLVSKRRRLTSASERGYRTVLDEFVNHFPDRCVTDFEPFAGSILIEDFLADRWGQCAPRTYNRAFSVLHDFFEWYVARGVLSRDPMATLQRAKTRPIHRTTFSAEQCVKILGTNPAPRDQIALRLLLHYGLRKGALRNVRLEHFDANTRRLVIFTKGEQIHYLPIPEEIIWEHLAAIDEPRHHYLLPKQILRKRISPSRPQFAEASDLLGDLADAITAAIDPACVTEVGALAQVVDGALELLGLAAEAASVQVRRFPEEQIGEHGMHLYWYRCLARAGVVEKGTARGQRMHKARHTAGQRVLDRTGNLKAAQALLCHATIGTTGDIYTGWEIEQLAGTMRETLDLPDDLLGHARRSSR